MDPKSNDKSPYKSQTEVKEREKKEGQVTDEPQSMVASRSQRRKRRNPAESLQREGSPTKI